MVGSSATKKIILSTTIMYQFTLSWPKLHNKLLPHPPCSPYLAPCYFFLFASIKKWLSGKIFTPYEEVIAETNANLAVWEIIFLGNLKEIGNHWTNCIKLNEDCWKINWILLNKKFSHFKVTDLSNSLHEGMSHLRTSCEMFWAEENCHKDLQRKIISNQVEFSTVNLMTMQMKWMYSYLQIKILVWSLCRIYSSWKSRERIILNSLLKLISLSERVVKVLNTEKLGTFNRSFCFWNEKKTCS